MGLRDWIEETHSTGFELRRHFFARFFDSELVSSPGQWKVVVGGAIAMVLSLGIVFMQAYYHKYRMLEALDTPEPYRLAAIADALFMITLAMCLIGLFTTMQWPSLFPGLRDYLVLASLPLRMRSLFVARFTALITLAGLFIAAINLMPSVMLQFVVVGRYTYVVGPQILGIFVSASLAGWFVFFLLVAFQGVLLNVLPIRLFPRVSLALQGVLLTACLCALPLVFSIPSLNNSMTSRPEWAVWAPPLWFLGLDQIIVGHYEPYAMRLAEIGLSATGVAGVLAILTYFWSYRRHRRRLLESPGMETAKGSAWLAPLSERLLPNPRELAVFAFVAKMLARSRHHRMVLTAFAGIALAIIFESFVSLVLARGFHGFSTNMPGLRQAVISAPLALSLFVLAGFRYLFRLPVELRANWIFRTAEPGNRLAFLAAVEKFLVYCAVLPAALLTLPMELRFLGLGTGLLSALVCALCSLVLMELLLIQSEKIPFTSSYLPGKRPLIETTIIYGIAVTLYVSVLGSLISWCLFRPAATFILIGTLLAAWWKARQARRDLQEIGQLEFEEVLEPAVLTLSIDRD